MSLENKDSSSLIKSSEPNKSFSLYSTPIEEIADCIMSGGKILPRKRGEQKEHVDLANGLAIPRRIDEPWSPGV